MELDSIFNGDGQCVVRFRATETPKLEKQLSTERRGIKYFLRVFSNGSVLYSALDAVGTTVYTNPTIVNKVFGLNGTDLELHSSPVTINYIVHGLTEKVFKELDEHFGITEMCRRMRPGHGCLVQVRR